MASNYHEPRSCEQTAFVETRQEYTKVNMLLHYKNLGIVLSIVRRARDMLNSADLQDQQNRRFSHREPFSDYFLIRMSACRSLICQAAAASSVSRPAYTPQISPWAPIYILTISSSNGHQCRWGKGKLGLKRGRSAEFQSFPMVSLRKHSIERFHILRSSLRQVHCPVNFLQALFITRGVAFAIPRLLQR